MPEGSPIVTAKGKVFFFNGLALFMRKLSRVDEVVIQRPIFRHTCACHRYPSLYHFRKFGR
jgi:hypothetical protein